MKCDLVVISGTHVGKIISLQRHSVIGRDPDVEVSLPDTLVSKRHCEIRVGDEQVSVHDLGSKNGILLNGNQVREARLSHGDILTLGGHSLLYREPDALATKTLGLRKEEQRRTARIEQRQLDVWSRSTNRAENPEEELVFAFHALNLIELGGVLTPEADPQLLAEIVVAKTRAALEATRCALLDYGADGAAVVRAARGSGGDDPGELSLPPDRLAELKQTTEWRDEEADLIELSVPVAPLPGKEAAAIRVSRPTKRGGFSSFERGVLCAIAVKLESLSEVVGLETTRVFPVAAERKPTSPEAT